MTLFALVVASAQIGVILGISALAAPTVFAAIEPGAAGRYLRRLFPRYFATAAALALVAAAAAITGGEALAGLLLAADAVCFGSVLALVPRINSARDRGDPSFRRLHGYSVLGNGLGLVLALAAIVSMLLH